MDKILLIGLMCLLLRKTSASAKELPEPQNVHFYSLNLRNKLRWTPGESCLNETVYTVEYAIYGDAEVSNSKQVRWRSVEQCTSITQTECDVSEETSNLEEEYYARVRAVNPQTQSLWTETGTRFRPMSDTILGPPLVEVTVDDNYMNVKIKGPFRWKTKNAKKKSLWKFIPQMIYNVSVYNNKSKHMQYFLLKNGTLTLGPLEFSTQLCIMAQAQSQSLPLSNKPSEWTCAETPKDPFKDQMLVAMLGGVLPSALCLCVLAVLGGLIHCYITDHRQTLPKSTDLVCMSEKLQTFQPERPQTIILNLIGIGRIREESKLCSPAVLLQPDWEESLGNAKAQPLAAKTEPVSYAQQHLPASDSSGAFSEDSVRDYSELQLWLQEPQHNEAGDYGIVVPAAFETVSQHEIEVNLYRTQGNKMEPSEPVDKEEETQIFLDWSPETRELKIPLLSFLSPEDGEHIDTETDKVTLLPNVVVRQSSQDSTVHEDDIIKMERDWGLIIHNNSE